MKELIECLQKAKQSAEYMEWSKRLNKAAVNNRITNLAVAYYAQDNCKVYSKITCIDRARHYGVSIGSTVCIGVKISSRDKAKLIWQARRMLKTL